MVILISITVSFVSFKHKINPDNVTIPLITGAADILGVITLLHVMQLFGIL
jgi:cation transporter-like permease